jgi:hypothetical protein
MSDNMKGLDTFDVGYAAAKAKYQSELEALKRERAMLVEALKECDDKHSEWPECCPKLVKALYGRSFSAMDAG